MQNGQRLAATKGKGAMFVKVAVPGPFLSPLDYALQAGSSAVEGAAHAETANLLLALEPNEFSEDARDSESSMQKEILPVVGGRVTVPFRNKRHTGIVVALSEEPDVDIAKIK